MKIYEMGNKVWHMRNNKPVQNEITIIAMVDRKMMYGFRILSTDWLQSYIPHREVHISELEPVEKLFDSKEELIESL